MPRATARTPVPMALAMVVNLLVLPDGALQFVDTVVEPAALAVLNPVAVVGVRRGSVWRVWPL
jgi:hypothetical protein